MDEHPAKWFKVGDRFTMDVPVRRKWWQLWKPRQWTERREYRVVSEVAG